jgi:hypothetical protein
MIFDAQDAAQPLSRFEAMKKTRQRRCAEIAVRAWKEYFHPPQSTSKDLGSIQPTRGINDIQMGNRVSSLQSFQSDSTHHWERTLL